MIAFPKITSLMFGLSACIAASATTASAAVLSTIGGDVTVDAGSGPTRVGTVSKVQPGNRIVVGPNVSSVTITYGNGCSFPIAPGTALVVPQISPACDVSGVNSPQAPAPAPTIGTEVVIAGAVVAAGAIGVIAATQSSSSKSP